jgi:hypothetical protein
MRRRFIPALIGAFVELARTALGSSVPVPNHSFESPATSFVSINIDSWQKASKPDWYQEGPGFTWVQLTGAFKNTATNSPDHIDNCDGNQAIWLFAVPEVGLFQDYDSVDWKGQSNQFTGKFTAGKSYQLTVGVIGTGGGMLEGATLDLRLYYRSGTNLVIVGVTTLTNTPAIFSNSTHLVDCHLSIPVVKSSDPWNGKHIGIQVVSTVTTNLQGGYWDLDNVRLSEIAEPSLGSPVFTNGQFNFALLSEPGITFEILAATNPVVFSFKLDSRGFV